MNSEPSHGFTTNSPKPPAWVKDAVFYQVFPDRFAISELVSKPSNLESWDSEPTFKGYKGGDLLGLVEKLDYLVDLGINAIYLNPIFQSASNHRYHTHDYYQVDPLLGGNQALRTLIEEAHKRNVRIVLDGVFNHASRGFFQFNDLLENGHKSAWSDWFTIKGWPLNAYDPSSSPNYECWWDLPALPKLNTDNPEVREFIMRVAEFWLAEYDIDGWRLDVPTEIKSPGFWEEFRFRVKMIKPDAYIVGEIWHADPAWVNGSRFDALMNYEFAGAAIAFSGSDRVSKALAQGHSYHPYPPIDGWALNKQLEVLANAYDWDFVCSQLNITASHDTPRLLSLVQRDKDTQKLVFLLQMTFPGAPCIYYGDEIAIRGSSELNKPFKDTDARWSFPWQDRSLWDSDMLSYVKELIKLRTSSEILRHGRFFPRLAGESWVVFERNLADAGLFVAVNAGREEAVFDLDDESMKAPANMELLFGKAKLETVRSRVLSVTVPPRTGIIIG